MFHKLIIKDGNVTKVVDEVLVDGQEYVDEKPLAGSVNEVTSGGVAEAIEESADEIKEVIPPGTDEENPLVNEQNLADAIAAADLSGTPAEVAAAALCELKENIEAAAIDNAELAARVAALESAESADDSRAILSAPSIRNDVQVDEGNERTLEEVPELVKKETIDADEGDVTEK